MRTDDRLCYYQGYWQFLDDPAIHQTACFHQQKNALDACLFSSKGPYTNSLKETVDKKQTLKEAIIGQLDGRPCYFWTRRMFFGDMPALPMEQWEELASYKDSYPDIT
jgi:hypothetical protein